MKLLRALSAAVVALLAFGAALRADTLATATPFISDVRLYVGSGANDDDVLILTPELSKYDTCQVWSSTGAVEVQVSWNGTTWSNPMALQQLSATAVEGVLVTTAGNVFGFRGVFGYIRVRQNGATAAAAQLLCGKI